jgi:hypothetical protein
MVMSAFALLHGNAAFPAAFRSGPGWCGPKRAPQWALGLAAPATDPRGPQGGSDIGAPPGLRLLWLLHKGWPRSPH